MKRIAIIDVGSGNLYSVEKAVRHVAQENTEIFLCSDAAELAQATHVILPGVGAFADCMDRLNALCGMREALEAKVLQRSSPFLGICVGMQMLFERGVEYGSTQGLGWFKGEVLALEPSDKSLKIPHMGWNELQLSIEHPLLEGIEEGDHAYFVHSYHCVPSEDVTAVTVDYGGALVAAIARDNLFATQFHPEKSQKTGLRILQNFVQLPHAS
ncbi:MAG: imidazole glycerol phosphate synthase subunit HisH [Rickettsiales bacterium]|nr:imidazole glycerol phosphate synthase subunit HisH [Rickettsiales bacterium]